MNLLESVGGRPQKPVRSVPLATSRFFTGLYTNRSLLRGPLDVLYTDFYKMGTTDVLNDGLNSELSTRLTMIRRPGNPAYSNQNIAAAPDTFYSFRVGNAVQVIVDTPAQTSVLTPTTNTLIFTKGATAGQGYFCGINSELFMSDGLSSDIVKYTPSINNSINNVTSQPWAANNTFPLPIWNFGGAAPTVAPTFTFTETGSAGISWTASTVFSTMGLLLDSNGNVQQLNLVTLLGNTGNTGSTGTGQPSWNNTQGGSTTEGSGTPIVWKCLGQVQQWKGNTFYANQAPIYDPVTNCIFTNFHSAGATSQSVKPNFNSVLGSLTNENNGPIWGNVGKVGSTQANVWLPTTAYNIFNTLDTDRMLVLEPVLPIAATTTNPLPSGAQPIFLQASQTNGTSGSGYTPPWGTAAGAITQDNQNQWVCQGSATRLNNTPYTAWQLGQATFSVVKDTNTPTNFWVCTVSGVSGSSITWPVGPNYGDQFQDGTVTWSCVGPTMTWAANTKWFLPPAGFSPPTPYNPFGSAQIVDSNGKLEFVVISGLTGGVAPTWSTSTSGKTTDNAATWINEGAFTAVGLSWTKGYAYVYCYKARSINDPYVTTAPPEMPLITQSPAPLGAPKGCQDGTVTTASPVGQFASSNAGAIINVSGQGSLDPQFDTVSIFRSTDGSQSGGPFLFLTDIPMPPPVNGQPGTWLLQDVMPDLASTTLAGLNPLIQAPVGNANDPPPGQLGSTITNGTLLGLTYHQGRLWGFVGTTVYCSGGPDTNPGNGFTAWPPANFFPFQNNIVALMSVTGGLLVFTTNDLCLIAGGPSISTYYSQTLIPGLGVLSPNAVTNIAGIPYAFTSDKQLVGIESTGGFRRIGHNIGDKLNAFDPSKVYLTYHSYSDFDHAIFIADGSTGWYRCDPYLDPDSKYTGPVYSPFAQINGGHCGAIASIETSPGVTQLLIGDTRAAQKVLARDSSFTTFTDNGVAYDSYFTMGAIVLANPGQMAEMDFIEMDFVQTGSQPAVSVLLDELSATNGAVFEKISNSFVSDPPKLFGPTATPATLWMNRYYFGQTTPGQSNSEPIPAWCKFIQIKVDFGSTDTVQNELLAFTIFGSLWQEQ